MREGRKGGLEKGGRLEDKAVDGRSDREEEKSLYEQMHGQALDLWVLGMTILKTDGREMSGSAWKHPALPIQRILHNCGREC